MERWELWIKTTMTLSWDNGHRPYCPENRDRTSEYIYHECTLYIKRDSPTRFSTPSFFIIRTDLGHWLMGQNSFDFGLDSAEIFNFFWSSVQYDTARSQVPCSIILYRVKWLFRILFKRTVKQDFLPVLFIIRVCPGHWGLGWNIFIFGFVFAEIFKFFEIDSAQYHIARSQVLHSIILRWVKFRAVWYCAESLATARSQYFWY